MYTFLNLPNQPTLYVLRSKNTHWSHILEGVTAVPPPIACLALIWTVQIGLHVGSVPDV